MWSNSRIKGSTHTQDVGIPSWYVVIFPGKGVGLAINPAKKKNAGVKIIVNNIARKLQEREPSWSF
jgi:hypothetical protein